VRYVRSLYILQWSVVGDTFPVGCRPSDHIVFGTDSFTNNQDFTHPVYRCEVVDVTDNTWLTVIFIAF